MPRTLFACWLLVLTVCPLAAEEWPAWRGPRGDGTVLDRNVPVRWGVTENVAWKAEVPGVGHSSPVIWGDRVFVTSCLLEEGRRLLLCYNRRDGKKLWERAVLEAPLEKKHKLNSFASSTPATDGERVFVAFLEYPKVRVVAYDFAGNKVWDKSPGEFHSRHGFCSSPVLYKDKVIVNCDQDALAYIVALDRQTGGEHWRIDRPNRIRSYCVPLIVEAAGRTQMALSGCKCVTGYDPEDGKLLWSIDGPTEQYVASLVYGQGLFFLTAGFPTFHNMAIRPDGTGDVTGTHVAWHESKTSPQKASYVPSPVFHDRYFFVVSDKGPAHCFDAKTGERLWMEQLGQHHSASPIVANGLLYFPADRGETYVVKAGPKFEVVAVNDLGEECYASPAVSRGQLFLRTTGHLWCIGGKEER